MLWRAGGGEASATHVQVAQPDWQHSASGRELEVSNDRCYPELRVSRRDLEVANSPSGAGGGGLAGISTPHTTNRLGFA